MCISRTSCTPGDSGSSGPRQECDMCGRRIEERAEYQTVQLAAILCSACMTQPDFSAKQTPMVRPGRQVIVSCDQATQGYLQRQTENQHTYIDALYRDTGSFTAWSSQFAFQSSSFAMPSASQESIQQLSTTNTWFPDQNDQYATLNNDGLSYFSLNVMLAGSTPHNTDEIATPASPSSTSGALSDVSTHDQALLVHPANLILSRAEVTRVRNQTLAFVGGANNAADFDAFLDVGFAEG